MYAGLPRKPDFGRWRLEFKAPGAAAGVAAAAEAVRHDARREQADSKGSIAHLCLTNLHNMSRHGCTGSQTKEPLREVLVTEGLAQDVLIS